MELFKTTGKLKKKFFLQLEMFDVCSDRHTAIRYLSSSAVSGRPLDFCLHRHTFSVNCLYHARMVLSVGESFAYFAPNARCTVTTDLLVWYSNTQNCFSPGAAIFSLHTLVSPSGRNVNYDEKQLTVKKFLSSFYLYRFCKYVSCGFPIINFCNPGVHYETPCTFLTNKYYCVLLTYIYWFMLINPLNFHPQKKLVILVNHLASLIHYALSSDIVFRALFSHN